MFTTTTLTDFRRWGCFLPVILILLFGCQAGTAEPTVERTEVPATTAPIKEEPTTMNRFLALGDSYTIGESVPEVGRWPVQLAALLQEVGIRMETPQIVARTGWTTAELSGAIAETLFEPGYDLVSLLIGVNNQYRGYPLETYREEFAALLGQAIGFAGGDPHRVLVLSIPDWGATPFAINDPRGPEAITAEVIAFNAINRAEAARLGVVYIDIFPISQGAYSDPALIAADGLHPSQKQYELWAQAAMPAAVAVLGGGR